MIRARPRSAGPCYTDPVPSRILAFRPASTVARLAPRSEACPLSTADVLGGADGVVLPLLLAPTAAVARAALLAAKLHRAAVGLALPAGTAPGPWFAAVTGAASELAPGLPIFLAAEVRVDGEGATQVERAVQEAFARVDAGLTHLAVDVAAVEPPERGRVFAEVAQSAQERGLCVDLVLPRDPDATEARRTAALLDDLDRRGVAPELASVRCPAVADAAGARSQAVALARLAGALRKLPLLRRGPASPALLPLLSGSPVRACEDGGAVGAETEQLLPEGAGEGPEEREARAERLEQALGALPDGGAERIEARAFLRAQDFLEALGAPGSADQVARALGRRLDAR